MLGPRQTEELRAVLQNLIRVGTVTELDGQRALARVVFPDRDNMPSYWLSVMVRNTLKNADYWMPDIDEQVLCLFLPVGMENGFIVGSYYTTRTAPPADTGNKRVIKFEDGTVIEYDRESHTLKADVQGDAEITTTGKLDATVGATLTATVAGDTTVTTPQLILNGNLVVNGTASVTGAATVGGLAVTGAAGGAAVTGDIVATGDVKAGAISLTTHTHGGVSTGSGSTGGPQ